MTEKKRKGPEKDAAKKMTEFRKARQKQPTAELLKKALKNSPKKPEVNNPNKRVALPDAEV